MTYAFDARACKYYAKFKCMYFSHEIGCDVFMSKHNDTTLMVITWMQYCGSSAKLNVTYNMYIILVIDLKYPFDQFFQTALIEFGILFKSNSVYFA